MSIPNSPTEGGGDKLLFLNYNNGGTNAAALFHAPKTTTMNSETVGWAAVATHVEGASIAASGTPPLVLGGGRDSSGTARAIMTDSSGRLIAVGGAGHGSTVAGDPIRLGGVFRSTRANISTGTRIADISVNQFGHIEAGIAQGTIAQVFNAATASGTVTVDTRGFSALAVMHVITNGSSYVSCRIHYDSAAGSSVPHHGGGQNIKSSAQTADYSSLFTGLTETTSVVLNHSNGTSSVWVIPLVAH